MEKYRLVEKIDDNYSVIEIIDNQNNIIRVLKSQNSNQSATYTDERKYQLYDMFSNLYDITATFKNDVSKVLMLGGGGFSYAKYYISKYSNKTMDVVEIDKRIIEVAKKYFYLEDLYNEYDKNQNRLKIFNMDAEKYILECSTKYDSILIDLFIDLIPIKKFFLMPMLEKIYDILKTDGCLCINYIITNSNIEDFKELYQNLQKFYSNIYIKTTELAFYNNLGNIFIICSNTNTTFKSLTESFISIDIKRIINMN